MSIPCQVARRFFTRVKSQTVSSSIGQSIMFKKLIIWFGIIASPILFFLFMVAVVYYFGFTAASLIIPATGICWTIIYGLTSEHGGWRVGTIPLLISIGLTFVVDPAYSKPFFLFALSLWLQRTTFLLSTTWLVNIVASSYTAYEELVDHVTITSMN